jgi:hypothetical protein
MILERFIDSIRALLIIVHGKYIVARTNVATLGNAKKLINTSVILIMVHLVIISMQYYFSWIFMQDVVSTWQNNLKGNVFEKKSDIGTFTYSRTRVGPGYVNQNIELMEEEVDISLIAIGMVLAFLFLLLWITVSCLLIIQPMLSYKAEIIKLEGIYQHIDSVELDKVVMGEFEPAYKESQQTFVE